MAVLAYLSAARQSRLTAQACVLSRDAALHKAAARFWLAQARIARLTGMEG